METWRATWRKGFAPFLPTEGLKRLASSLLNHGDNLLRGATTSPPPLQCVQDWPVEAACPVGTCYWSDGATVDEVQQAFAQACYKADVMMGESAACRFFLNAWDEGDISSDALLDEVMLEIERRNADRPILIQE